MHTLLIYLAMTHLHHNHIDYQLCKGLSRVFKVTLANRKGRRARVMLQPSDLDQASDPSSLLPFDLEIYFHRLFVNHISLPRGHNSDSRSETQSDIDEGPQETWERARHFLSFFTLDHSKSCEVLRGWGYVFWNRERIQSWERFEFDATCV